MKKRGKPKSKGTSRRQPEQALRTPARAAASQVVIKAQPYQPTVWDTTRPLLPVGLSWNTHRVAPAAAYGADERRALIQLMVPVLLFATVLALSHAFKTTAPYLVASASPMVPDRPIASNIITAPLALPSAAPHVATIAPPPVPGAAKHADTAPGTIILPAIALPTRAPEVAALPTLQVPLPIPSQTAVIVPEAPFSLPSDPPRVTTALMPIPPAMACVATPRPPAASAYAGGADFGTKLAEAAKAQTNDFVIYNATYKRIAYPMGDIPSLYGSCSDVVIRAYRALGIDLQELVQKAKVGSGDPNIDHRRTETLRIFFSRYGEKIAPSSYGEDYKPGDIVTYYRPYSRVSKAHIAVVSDVIGPSGHPMIVHNRGWGPQLEDALFVDRITGHYRFRIAPSLVGIAAQSGSPTRDQVSSSKAAVAKPAVLPAKRASVDSTVR